MEVERIRELIAEEIARQQLAEQLEKKEQSPKEWLRHPIFLTALAFVFTTLLGGSYDQVLEDRKRDRILVEAKIDQAISEEHASTLLLQNFVALSYERVFHARRLRYALETGDGDLVSVHLGNYDKVYQKWSTELPQNLLMLRALSGFERKRSIYETAVERTLDPAFGRMNTCLFHAYTVFKQSGAAPVPRSFRNWQCQTSDTPDPAWSNRMIALETTVHTCTYAILTNLLYQIRDRTNRVQDNWRQPKDTRIASPERLDSSWVERIEAELAQACPKPGSKT